MLLANLSFVSSPGNIFSRFLEYAGSHGLDAKSMAYPEGANERECWVREWKKAFSLLEKADAFLITETSVLTDENFCSRLQERIFSGTPGLVLTTENNPEAWNRFLEPFGIETTCIRVCAPDGARLVTFERSEDTFRSAELFMGGQQVIVQQPNVLKCTGEALPVLVAANDVLLVDGSTDLPATNILSPVACAVEWCNQPGTHLLALSGSNLHNPYISITGQDFPGIMSNQVFAQNVIRYICHHITPDGDPSDRLAKMVSDGEGPRQEFKETLRYDIRQAKHSSDITFAAIKSLAAFMNTDGGRLFIGVDDSGKIVGLDRDGFGSDDKFLLYLTNKAKSLLGKSAAVYLRPRIDQIREKALCIVECKKSPEPMFLKSGNKEFFFVRIGPQTVELTHSEMLEHLKSHFQG